MFYLQAPSPPVPKPWKRCHLPTDGAGVGGGGGGGTPVIIAKEPLPWRGFMLLAFSCALIFGLQRPARPTSAPAVYAQKKRQPGSDWQWRKHSLMGSAAPRFTLGHGPVVGG